MGLFYFLDTNFHIFYDTIIVDRSVIFVKVTDVLISEAIINAPNDPRPALIGPQNVISPFFIPAAMNIGLTVGFNSITIGDRANIKIVDSNGKDLIVLPEIQVTKELVNPNLTPEQNSIFLNSGIQNLVIRVEKPIKVVVTTSDGETFEREYPVFAKERV